MNEICPFCFDQEVKDRMIYEDELVMVFPTFMPIVPGHILICPKRHIEVQDDLKEDELLALGRTLKELKAALKKSFQAEGFNIAWNEGKLSGQSVPHMHIHLLPRKEGDAGVLHYKPREFIYRPGERPITPQQELLEVSKLIKKHL